MAGRALLFYSHLPGPLRGNEGVGGGGEVLFECSASTGRVHVYVVAGERVASTSDMQVGHRLFVSPR